jgi:hypothetical protein
VRPKHARGLKRETLREEEWEVIPSKGWDPFGAPWRKRSAALVRCTYSKASRKPPEFHIELWAGDLDGYPVEPPAVCSTELEARSAFEVALAEMKKLVPWYFVET